METTHKKPKQIETVEDARAKLNELMSDFYWDANDKSHLRTMLNLELPQLLEKTWAAGFEEAQVLNNKSGDVK